MSKWTLIKEMKKVTCLKTEGKFFHHFILFLFFNVGHAYK